ncbi:hypothetical protein KVT40_008980 [Elsinoe batatas]|uniref:MARVEL domain-containing protein n=1 Tax=Elsinoe batatas TaxID=2601811 RepID=A0A8K0KUA1_9PEZI|nr:hypothetical protein KVT40_008980 [Elsinoe batatas]
MPVPDYGAAPLAKFFLLCRLLSLIAMIAIVGMTANFVATIVSHNFEPPKEVVGALSITCIATLYTLLSIPFFYAQASLGLFIMTGIDGLLLLAFLVISIVFGRPLSYLNCYSLPTMSLSAEATNAAAWAQSLTSNVGKIGARLGLWSWAGASKVVCFQTKAIWGLCIALCILFTCTCLILPTLFFKNKKKMNALQAKVVV